MRALVTGGGGFLGGAIVRMLVNRGDRVRSFARSHYPALEQLGVEQRQGDLVDAESLIQAMAGCDIVFHVAAKAGYWGPYQAYFRANVLGTRNVIMACREKDIRRLVYTSSPSVVHTGGDLEGVNESAPIPDRFEAAYPATKAIAEREVLVANGPDLATVALRPHLVWGPGDNHLIPRLIDRARRGQLRLIGDGRKLVDVTYIDDAAAAHILAADRLFPGSSIAGKAYFISQGQPVAIADFINRVLALANLPPLRQHISVRKAIAIATILEMVYSILQLSSEPRLTRFVVRQFSTAHWFDISAARRDLGYQPTVSIEEGFQRLGQWLQPGKGGGPASK